MKKKRIQTDFDTSELLTLLKHNLRNVRPYTNTIYFILTCCLYVRQEV